MERDEDIFEEVTDGRILLRAELHHHDGRIVVAHTLKVTSQSLSIACPEIIALGTALRVTLSFPQLVEPFDVTVRVVGTTPDGGPGKSPSIVCEVTSAVDRARKALDAIVAMTSGSNPTIAEKGYRCLLVDDSTLIRELFAYSVERFGRTRQTEMTLDVAADTEKAWSMLEKGAYDLVIVDHFLPSETGTAFIGRMRAVPALAKIPVVAISVGGPDIRASSIAAGADLFLDKPIVLKDLFSTLDRLTARPTLR